MQIANNTITAYKLLEWTVDIVKAKMENDNATISASETSEFMEKVHETLLTLAKKSV